MLLLAVVELAPAAEVAAALAAIDQAIADTLGIPTALTAVTLGILLRGHILLANVRGATEDPGIAADPNGIRAPGARVPGVIAAGTFYLYGEKVF